MNQRTFVRPGGFSSFLLTPGFVRSCAAPLGWMLAYKPRESRRTHDRGGLSLGATGGRAPAVTRWSDEAATPVVRHARFEAFAPSTLVRRPQIGPVGDVDAVTVRAFPIRIRPGA